MCNCGCKGSKMCTPYPKKRLIRVHINESRLYSSYLFRTKMKIRFGEKYVLTECAS